jgi:hypothetical protein
MMAETDTQLSTTLQPAAVSSSFYIQNINDNLVGITFLPEII